MLFEIGETKGTASFSHCRKYRWDLLRTWNEDLPTCAFICLNPSTADETDDDPTVRRCINYARSWGMGRFVMLNAYAYRSTDPKALNAVDDPVGLHNDHYIKAWSRYSSLVVAAWGVHCEPDRAETIKAMIPGLRYLRLTKNGCPGHPLYLPKNLEPKLWT